MSTVLQSTTKKPACLLAAIPFALCSLALSGQAAEIRVPAGDEQALIAAVETANAREGADRIILTGNLYTFRQAHATTRASALPAITSAIEMVGDDTVLSLYTNQPLSHLTINPGGELTLRGVNLRDGTLGAIVNAGKLTLIDSVLEDNTSGNAASALLNNGEATLVRSRVQFNSLNGTVTPGGAIRNAGTLRLIDSVVAGNSAVPADPLIIVGSALLNAGDVVIEGSAIVDNQSDWGLTHSIDAQRLRGAIANLPGARFQADDLALADNVPAAFAAVSQ